MAKKASIICLKCGRAIHEPVKFCPYCAAALPGTEAAKEKEAEEQEQEHGYWDFYGAVEPEDVPVGPMGARGWLRFVAACVFVASFALGMALNGWSWGFRWTRAAIFWVAGTAVAVLLFVLSFFFKPKD